MKPAIISGLLFITCLILSCGRGDHGRTISDEEYENTRRALVGANRILVKKDYERMKSFIERKGWEMEESASGLWYQVYEEGNGRTAGRDMLVSLRYSLSLPTSSLFKNSFTCSSASFEVASKISASSPA